MCCHKKKIIQYLDAASLLCTLAYAQAKDPGGGNAVLRVVRKLLILLTITSYSCAC